MGLCLLLPTSTVQAHDLSERRAKVAIRDSLEYDYTVQRHRMWWDCAPRSDHWVRCAFAFKREGGTRWWCGFGSVRLRQRRVRAVWTVYDRCWPKGEPNRP